MELSKIELVLENSDIIEIPAKYVADISIEDITTTIKHFDKNNIVEMQVSDAIFINLDKQANQLSTIGKISFIDESEKDENTYYLFDRLSQAPDITSIEIYLADKDNPTKARHYVIYANWIDCEKYINKAEKVSVAENGNLYIFISSKNLEDDTYFEKHILSK